MSTPGMIRLRQSIPRPPARVWAALTDAALLGKWWAKGDIRAVVGHRFTLDMGQWGMQKCVVLVVEPGKVLSYSFAAETLDTTITWRLQPEGAGTSLSLEHGGFDLDSLMGKSAFVGMRTGWPSVLARLAPALA
jgi:uncharacterized protein YndB with AHSA1/START domain